MKAPTILAFNAYLNQQAKLNNVDNVARKFNMLPSVQQTLEAVLQMSSEFLKKINIIGVTDKSGEKLGLGIGSTIASRTNTGDGTPRKTSDPSDINGDGYDCTKTDFDTHLRYSKLDAWAKFPKFQSMIRDAVIQRCALDRIMIGFNGTSRAPTTDRAANPLLQDVNIGWLEKIRQKAPQHVMKEGEVPGEVSYGPGAGADYANLDALVMDARHALVDPVFRNDGQLVVLVSADLLHDKMFTLVQKYDQPTETAELDMQISQRRLGGLQAVVAPYFPDGTILITRLDNLSIYYQEGARRRAVIDKPELDQVNFYESSNDDYVVEDYGQTALVQNIKHKE